MGHLTLISEDVIGALEHFPPDLRLIVAQYAPQPDWDEYVSGRYRETKKKDTSLLGGGKPVIAPGMRNGAAQWKVDEADALKGGAGSEGQEGRGGGQGEVQDEDEDMGRGMAGEFRRSVRTTREVSADFGAMEDDDEDDDDAFQTGPPHVRVSCRVPLTLMFHYAFHDSLLATSPRRYSQASTTLTIPLRTTKTIVDGSPTLPSNCVRHQCLHGNMRPIEDRLVQAVST